MLRHLTRISVSLTVTGLFGAGVVAGSAGQLALASTQAVRAHRSVASRFPAPFGREWQSWAYDPAQHDVVLFGGDTFHGNNGGKVLGKTWTWNGRWTEKHPAKSPSARTGAAIVYDPATKQLLLFGGSTLLGTSGGYLGDTWSWNGRNWIKLHPASSPSARHNADMIYDAATRQVLLFGGYDFGYLGDTWSWNGRTWTQLHPASSPSARDTESLVYDPVSKTAIMFGGFSSSTGRLGDTWSWNGRTWTQLHPATSPGRVSPVWQSAYDPATKQLIVYGGDNDEGFSQSTWAWTGKTWTALNPAANPGPRGYGAMTYDLDRKELLLLDGRGDSSVNPRGVWKWNGRNWLAP
jgi:hypothetical protein